MSDIKVEMTIYQLLQEVRNELLNKTELKKSGRGNTGKREYPYFELADFLPKATELFNERGICPIFSISFDSNGIEMATLRLFKGSETITFTMPTAESVTSSNPIQNQGSKITYLRRYLYMMCLDLVENDIVDATNNEEVVNKSVEDKKATAKQVEMIRSLYDEENISKILEYYNIETLEDLSLKDASMVIAKKKG